MSEFKRTLPGLFDEEFVRGNIPMTKREVRISVLTELALNPDSKVLDVGAGTGSISIEAALMVPQGHVWAIEKEAEGIELIKANAQQLGATNLTVLSGTAPEEFSHVPEEVDRVVVGGSGGKLEEILSLSGQRLREGGRLVATAVTTGTVDRICRYYAERRDQYQFLGYQTAITRLRPAGSHFLFQAQNPVYILVALKKKKSDN